MIVTLALGWLLHTDPCAPPCPPDAVLENEPCGVEINRGCFGAPPRGSDCCVVHDTPFCDNPECLYEVCLFDDWCCYINWDSICVGEVMQKCPELCAGLFPLAWSPIEVGQAVCGTTSAPPGASKDVDWYEFHLDVVTEVEITLACGVEIQLALIDADGLPDCAFALEPDPVAVSRSCNASLKACLEAGTHWIVVNPTADGTLPCGDPGTDYVLSLQAIGTRCILPDPVNDTCAAALPITLGDTPISTQDAAAEPDAPSLACPGGGDLSDIRDVWYEYVATRSGVLRLSACGTTSKSFFPVLVVYTGGCGGLQMLACDEHGLKCPWHAPEIDLDVVEGETYLLRIGSQGTPPVNGGPVGFEGDLVLTLSYLPCTSAYSIEQIDVEPNVNNSTATAISSDGKVAGLQFPLSGGVKAFLWSEADGLELLTPSGATVTGINSAGTIVGYSGSGTNTIARKADRLDLLSLPTLPSCLKGVASKINDEGVIAGRLFGGSCTIAGPALWIDNVPTPLDVPQETKAAIDINNLGNCCGISDGSGTAVKAWALIDSRFHWIESPDTNGTIEVASINDANQVVGTIEIDPPFSGSFKVGYVWQDGIMIIIEPPSPFSDLHVFDIADDGTILAELKSNSSSTAPILLRGGRFIDLNSRTGPESVAVATAVREINAAGQVSGEANHRAGRIIPLPVNADLTCDGLVNGADLGLLLASWGECAKNTACAGDFNVDGVIDGADLGLLLSGWTG